LSTIGWLFSLLHCLCIRLQSLAFFLFDGLVDLDTDNLRQSAIDFAFTVSRKTSVGIRDIVPEEEDVEEHRKQERQSSKDPNDKCEGHARKNDGLLML
jgi:hypothetical protein